MTAPVVYGVDFGTSTSAIAIGLPDGRLVHVKDPEAPGEGFSIPTSVCVDKRGRVEVGRAAENSRAMRPPGAYRGEFKLEVGSDDVHLMGGREFRADQLATEVLRHLRECARQTAAAEPEAVVLTIPAAWVDTDKEKSIRAAAAAAGFDEATLHCVAEPVAALATICAEHRPARDTVFCVYDLGGGTFDAALARSTGDDFELLGSPSCDPKIGGARFDRMIRDWVRDRFPGPSAELFDGSDETLKLHDRNIVLDLCRKIKIGLSVRDPCSMTIYPLGEDADIEMSRADLAELIGPLLHRTFEKTDDARVDAGLSWPEVDVVVPVGGSTRLPMIAEMLFEFCERRVQRVTDPDLAVVTGAALLARRLATGPVLPTWLDPDDPIAPILRAGLSFELVKKVLRRN